MAIDWHQGKRKKLGKALHASWCQHKAPAPHLDARPPTTSTLYDDIDIPEPNTLFDTWEDEGRIPAQHQEMEIDRSHVPRPRPLRSMSPPTSRTIPKQRRPLRRPLCLGQHETT